MAFNQTVIPANLGGQVASEERLYVLHELFYIPL